jgi:hypothetical protein
MTQAATLAAPSLPVDILDRPRWRVRIRPTIYIPNKLPSLGTAWELMDSAAVRLRGWDYPHVDHESRTNGNAWIASWVEFGSHLEYWRLYQSGQFVHHFAFWEDLAGENYLDDALNAIQNVPLDAINGFLDPFGVLYRMTEIYQFASKLALLGVLGSRASVEISMFGTKDRILYATDRNRWWHRLFRCTEDRLEMPEQTIDTGELVQRAEELALSSSVWIFERFSWLNPSKESLRSAQQRMLAGFR